MELSVQLNKLMILGIFVFLETLFPTLHAQIILPKQQHRLFKLLKQYGNEVKKGAEFYNAGVSCHQHTLENIVYINKRYLSFIFFNDSLGNCTLVLLNLSQIIPPNSSAAYSCSISNSVARQIFTPWYLDAIKSEDQTQKTSPLLLKFFEQMQLCFKPANVEEVIVKLESAIQVAKTSEKIDVH